MNIELKTEKYNIKSKVQLSDLQVNGRIFESHKEGDVTVVDKFKLDSVSLTEGSFIKGGLNKEPITKRPEPPKASQDSTLGGNYE